MALPIVTLPISGKQIAISLEMNRMLGAGKITLAEIESMYNNMTNTRQVQAPVQPIMLQQLTQLLQKANKSATLVQMLNGKVLDSEQQEVLFDFDLDVDQLIKDKLYSELMTEISQIKTLAGAL